MFSNDRLDRQCQVNHPSGSTKSALAVVSDNAADSTMWGCEIEFAVPLIEGLTISGGPAHIDANYDKFESIGPATGDLEDPSARPFTHEPECTATLFDK